jgi:hypothetical protein
MIATHTESRIDELSFGLYAAECDTRAVEFTDASHNLFAVNLDNHEIAWRYKPRTFAVEWDVEGNFVGSFTPDFYLPDYDQYVELASEGLLAEKMRKVRLLRQNYPEVTVRLIQRPTIPVFRPGSPY